MKKGYVCQGGMTQTIQEDLSTKEEFRVVRIYVQAMVKYED